MYHRCYWWLYSSCICILVFKSFDLTNLYSYFRVIVLGTLFLWSSLLLVVSDHSSINHFEIGIHLRSWGHQLHTLPIQFMFLGTTSLFHPQLEFHGNNPHFESQIKNTPEEGGNQASNRTQRLVINRKAWKGEIGLRNSTAKLRTKQRTCQCVWCWNLSAGEYKFERGLGRGPWLNLIFLIAAEQSIMTIDKTHMALFGQTLLQTGRRNTILWR